MESALLKAETALLIESKSGLKVSASDLGVSLGAFKISRNRMGS